MITKRDCGKCEGGKYEQWDEYGKRFCSRCNGTGIDPLWAELTRLKQALGAIHEMECAYDEPHHEVLNECETALPETGGEGK